MRLDWARATVLTLVQADVLCDVLGIDDPPAVLDLPHHGRTPAERDRIVSATVDGLRRRGPSVGALAGDLRLLARPALAFDLVHRHRTRLGAVAAVDGAEAVLAVRHEDEVALLPIPPAGAAAALVELLGPLRPAAGATVRVPVPVLAEAVREAGDDSEQLAVGLMRRGMTGAAARALVAANHEVDALSRLGVGVRTPDGLHRGPQLLHVQHNAAGHHRQRRRPGPPEMVESGPIDRFRLLSEIDELVAAASEPYRRGAGLGSTRPAAAGGIGSWIGASTR